jgi:hypothetical protein
LHEYARKLSREAYRFHTSAIAADPRSSKVQARYDELAKYFYRFERSYYASAGNGYGRGSRVARSFHELSRAFDALDYSWLQAKRAADYSDRHVYAAPPAVHLSDRRDRSGAGRHEH